MRTDRAASTTVIGLAAVFAVFFLLPFLGLAWRAWEDGRAWELARSRPVLEALRLSLVTSSVTLLIAVLFGTPVAYLLSRAAFSGRAFVDALIDLPIVLPPTVAGVALLTAFGRRGLLGEPLFEALGVQLTFTATAVVMAQTLVAVPFYVRAARAGFDAVDTEFERVAYTLGASRSLTFVRVVLPQARAAVLSGLALCWARSMGELGATLIFAGNLPGRTQTMPLAILDAFEGSSLGLPGAVSLSIVLLAVALGLSLLVRRLTGWRRAT